MSGVPNVFGSATSSIPLSQLDVNFNTPVTIGNTTVGLGNTVTSFGNVTLTNTTVTVGNVTTDLTVHGLTVGQGGGSVSTNTAMGASALATNSTGSRNTVVGYLAGTTTNDSYNVFVGYQAGKLNTGNTNTAIGDNVLASSGAGSNNSAFGQGTMGSNTTGNYNSAFGTAALASNTTGANNTAVGYQAGYSTSSVNRNTFVGYTCGYNTTGAQNTFIGDTSGNLVTSGASNTILGRFSGNSGGLDIRTLNNYIVLSDGDGNPRGIFDNSGNLLVRCTSSGFGNDNGTSIENGAMVQRHVNGTASGSPYTYFIYNGNNIGTIAQNGTTGVLYNLTSDYRLKNNQQPLTGAKDFIMALQPKKWQWWDGSGEGVGFVAHEFMEVAKYSGHGEKDAVDADGKPVYQSIQPSSSEVMANLVSFIQELSAQVTTLQAQINGASA